MTRKWVLSAAVTAAGVFAVGCGQVNDAASKASQAATAASGKVKEGAEKAKEEAGRVAEAAGGKVKEAVDELNKQLPPIQTKLDDIEKSMTAEKDAGKKAELAKLWKTGTEKMKEIADAIKTAFAPEKMKDLANSEAVAKAKEAIMTKIAELKKMLGL